MSASFDPDRKWDKDAPMARMNAMAAALKELDPCGSCTHADKHPICEPCKSCGRENCHWTFDEMRFSKEAKTTRKRGLRV